MSPAASTPAAPATRRRPRRGTRESIDQILAAHGVKPGNLTFWADFHQIPLASLRRLRRGCTVHRSTALQIAAALGVEVDRITAALPSAGRWPRGER